jgi:dTDP-4-dehydrorhamnose reductase
VTGAGGQVGRALRALLPGANFFSHEELDVRDGPAVARALAGCDVAIHAAALTDVDGCERDPDAAFAVNACGTDHVCAAASRVVYLSTDYVFDGGKDGPYDEDDEPAPINAYGRSKLAGERAVLRSRRNLVVRTSWVYGEGRNFVRSIVRAAHEGRELRVVADQHGRPTAACDLAAALAALVETDVAGIVHVAGDGEPASWADLAEHALGRRVQRIASADYPTAARRPRNSVLSLERARGLGLPLVEWRGAVSRYVRRLA